MSVFGTYLRVSTFGESHCSGVGCIIDGVPPRLSISSNDIQYQLNRRRPGQSALTTARNESDTVEIISGCEGGLTLGTPICLLVRNKDQRPNDYISIADIPRPSHADYTYQLKYGIRASSGGGRASARETIGRVAAGSIAEKWLNERYGINIIGWVSSVGTIKSSTYYEENPPDRSIIDANYVRCPDIEAANKMSNIILDAKNNNDSVGGIITCVVTNMIAGLGEPVFDKLEALLAHAMMSIPATKGFEIGSGFEGTKMRGSQHNDPFKRDVQQTQQPHTNNNNLCLTTVSNNSGGIQGGISNGNNLIFRVAFKPPATIGISQSTVDFNGQSCILAAEGRHDPCVVPRAVPIVEAMCALVLADTTLQQIARTQASHIYPIIGKVQHDHRYREQQMQHIHQTNNGNSSNSINNNTAVTTQDREAANSELGRTQPH